MMAQAAKDFNHPEAFCHMRYQSEDGRESEIIWNSRNGVTPFMVASRSGKMMQHVDWRNDRRDAHYKPKPGDRIFVDATREMLLDLAKKRVEENWNHPQYPMSEMFETKDAAVEMLLEDWTKRGGPALVEVLEDGGYKHAD
jgi:hypothetical protein